MAFHYIKVTYILTLLAFITISKVNTHNQECSLASIDLNHCSNPGSLDSCCTTLNQAVQVGYNCICSLLGSTSTSPVLSTVLTLSFSSCFIAIPPLTRCQDPISETAPPVASMPRLMPPDNPISETAPPVASMPRLMPPDNPISETAPPVASMPRLMPPEVPLNSTDYDYSIGNSEPEVNISPPPKLSITEHSNDTTSDSANTKDLMNSRILLILALYAYIVVP